MTVKPDSRKLTPEAQLRAYIDKLDPKNQKLFDRSGLFCLSDSRPPTSWRYYSRQHALVIGYSPADRGIDAIVAIRHVPPVYLCTSIRDLSCPTRNGCWGVRKNRLASFRWRRPAS